MVLIPKRIVKETGMFIKWAQSHYTLYVNQEWNKVYKTIKCRRVYLFTNIPTLWFLDNCMAEPKQLMYHLHPLQSKPSNIVFLLQSERCHLLSHLHLFEICSVYFHLPSQKCITSANQKQIQARCTIWNNEQNITSYFLIWCNTKTSARNTCLHNVNYTLITINHNMKSFIRLIKLN